MNKEERDFRAVILAAIKAQRMTKTELSKRTGIPYSTLNLYLSGEGDTSGERIAKLLSALAIK